MNKRFWCSIFTETIVLLLNYMRHTDMLKHKTTLNCIFLQIAYNVLCKLLSKPVLLLHLDRMSFVELATGHAEAQRNPWAK